MSSLPPGWKRAALADLGTWYGGGTPSKAKAEFWTDGTVPWLSPKDMGPDTLVDTKDHITEDAVERSAARLVPAGSVALVVRSGILERTVPIALVPFQTTLNQDMKALVPKPDIDPRWVAWGLRSVERHLLDQCRKAGTTVASLDTRKAMATVLPVPPLEEQQRVVAILEDHLSRLDAALEFLARGEVRLRGLTRAVLARAVPTDAPPGWRVATVGEAGVVQLGRQRHPDWHNGPMMRPYLRVANVFEDRIDTTDLMEMDFSGVFERYRLQSGDVLLNEGQSPEWLGRPAIYRGEPEEVAFTNSLLRFKAGRDVMPEWALLVFRRHMNLGRFRKESRITTNIAHLSAGRLKTVEFPLPPLSEQERLVQTTTAQLESVDRLRDEITARRAQAASLRRALLAAAFTGRLTSSKELVDQQEEMAGV